MGFPGKRSFVIKIWELPTGEWSIYFLEDESSSSYLFHAKAPTFGEVMMTAIINGYKVMNEKDENIK